MSLKEQNRSTICNEKDVKKSPKLCFNIWIMKEVDNAYYCIMNVVLQ